MANDAALRIAVIGLGYVGLPLCRLFAQGGHTVLGIDADPAKIEMLRRNTSYLSDMDNGQLAEMTEAGRFRAGTDYAAVGTADAVLICVPTPLDAAHQPDLTFVRSAVRSLLPHVRAGQLIVLESSSYPGTTSEEIRPLLEARGFRIGTDVFLANSPERINPGEHRLVLPDIPKIVGGATPACTETARRLYGTVFASVVAVSSPEAAEMTKLIENSQRFINISFMNELAMLCGRMGLNVWECIDAAGTKPYGFTTFYPGPGIGGHCIPVDPLYLQWKARASDSELRSIEAAYAINEQMPAYIVGKVKANLPAQELAGRRILVVGVAYKKDVNDIRESPALRIMEELAAGGAEISFHDPYFGELRVGGRLLKRAPLDETVLRDQDCVLILTDHTGLPYDAIAACAPLVIDTRNATRGAGKRNRIVLL